LVSRNSTKHSKKVDTADAPAVLEPPTKSAEAEVPVESAVLLQVNNELREQADALSEARLLAELEQERYQQLFDFAPDGYLVTDLYGTIRMASRAAAALLGVETRFVIGKPLMIYVTPELRMHFRTQLQHIKSAGAPARWETRIQPRHDSEIDVAISVVRFFSPFAQEPGELLWQIQDLTEVKQRERNTHLQQAAVRNAFLLDFSDQLRLLTEPRAILAFAAKSVAKHLGADRVGYAEMDETGEFFTIEDDWTEKKMPSLAGRHRLDDFGEAGDQLRVGQTVIIDDAHKPPYNEAKVAAAFQAAHMIASVAAPLFKGTQFVSIFFVHQRVPRHWTADEVLLVNNVAERTWQAVNQARAEEALRESETKYRTLFNSMDEGYILVDLIYDENDSPVDILYVDANPAAVRLTGTDLVCKTTRQLDPNFEQHWFEIFGRVAKTGVGERHELSASPLDHWYNVYVFKVGDLTTRRVAAIYEDVTERKRMQLAEREQRLFAEALQSTALALTTSLNFSEVIDQILLNIGRVVPHDAAAFLLRQEDDSVYVARARGYGQTGASLSADVQDFHIAPGESDRIERMLRTHQPVLMSRWDEHGIWDDVPGMAVMQSLVAVPIMAHDEVIGFLKLHSRTPHFFIETHAKLLEVFAAQAAIAIQNARAYEQAQTLAVLNERHRLARELHDAVTQTLFSANMIAESLPRLWQKTPEPVQKQLQQLQLLTRGALAEMRTLLLELRPEYLTNMDLEVQIRQLVDALKVRKRLDVRVSIKIEMTIPPSTRIAFYRIAQEALNNVIKHAHATEVELTLKARSRCVQLIVQDNGMGFEYSTNLPGFGLHTMLERAKDIDALLDIKTAPQAGTRICVNWEGMTED
jgi:PAS domain S-box-containing protein